MTLKQYHQIKLILTVVVAIIFSQAIVFKNFIIPIIVLIISSLSLMILRRRVKEVVADERDYATAGQSALLAIQIYSWVAAIIMFILYAFRDVNSNYQPIAMTLAFSTCILMLLYSFLFRFNNQIKFKNKGKLIAFIIIFIVFLTIFIRLFSGEDSWVCRHGQWVKHGVPAVPAPTSICQ